MLGQSARAIEPQSEKQLNYVAYGLVGSLLLFTLLSGLSLGLGNVAATGTATGSSATRASIGVIQSCSMTATLDVAHTAALSNGTYSSALYPDGIGQTTIETFCNDPSGYSIYAVGYSGDTVGNTYLRSSALGSDYDIQTGTAESGATSAWSMKLASVSGTYAPTIQNGFSNYSSVPNNYTEVASYGSTTGVTSGEGSSLTTTYAAYISPTQPAGIYEGRVKYTLVHPAGETVPDSEVMQDVAYWGNSLLVGEEKTAIDTRDNNTYTVARICTNYSGSSCLSSQIWMTQNLKLVLNPSQPLTSLNTNLTTSTDPNGNTYAGYTQSGSIITWTPGSTLATPATISDFAYSSAATSVVSGWTNNQYIPYQALGQLNGNDVYIYTSGNTNRDTIYNSKALCEQAKGEGNCDHYRIGNYYNFSAAVATNDTTNYTTQYTVMPNSICPRGWRLPNGLTSDGSTVTMSEFNKLLLAQGVTSGTDLEGGVATGYTATGLNRIRTTGQYGDPLYFVRSGTVNSTTLYYSSSSGDYWSSTVATPGTYGYNLDYNISNVNPAAQYNRGYGRAIRCLAQQ